MKKSTVFLMILIISFGFSNLFAKEYGKKMKNPMMHVVKSLDLNDEQQQHLKQMMKQSRQERKAMRQSMKKQFQRDHATIFNNGNFNSEAFIQTHAKRATQRTTMQAQKIEKIMAILTQEQRQAFIAKMAQFNEERFERKQNHDRNFAD
jgi:Spy/CpxP family protein refolding chaperone